MPSRERAQRLEEKGERQKAFWLRADLADRLHQLRQLRQAAGRPVTEKEALNTAVQRYLEAEERSTG